MTTAILVIVMSILCALAGLAVVRHVVPLSFLETHHEVAGFFIGVLGAIYAILMGFVLVFVWERHNDAEATVAQETNQITDIVRLSASLPEERHAEIRAAAIAYSQSVLDHEWPAMARGESSPASDQAFASLWMACDRIQVASPREVALYTKLLDQLTELSDSRRQRLHSSRTTVPGLLWWLLSAGGIVTIVFTYFFGVKSLRSQMLMTAALTGEIALILVLILAFNDPFDGLINISPDTYARVLKMIEAVPVHPPTRPGAP